MLIVFGAIALGSIANFVVSFLNPDASKALYGDRSLLEQIAVALVPDTVLFLISAALGFWFGQRKKLAYQLAFIMKTVPEETSQLIVEMAQDEAMRASSRAVKPSS
jgi:arginyl-tRNA--protein-N-Asp/Glu arginylyltransferase